MAETFNHARYGSSMRPLLVRILDWFTIHYAALKLPKEIGLQSNLEQAQEILMNPHFIQAPEAVVAAPKFDKAGGFTFDSLTDYGPENNRLANGVFFKAGPWNKHPAVILVHGYNAEIAYQGVMREWAAQLKAQGINALMFELPFHGARRPVAGEPIRNFFCADLLHVGRAFQQAFYDQQGLIHWLREQGCPSIGLWGNSLGALISGNLSTIEGLVDSIALLSPVTRLKPALRDLAFAHTMKRSIGSREFPLQQLDLPTKEPAIAGENICVVSGKYDLFAPFHSQRELIRAWDCPNHQIHPEGHISILKNQSAVTDAIQHFRNVLQGS